MVGSESVISDSVEQRIVEGNGWRVAKHAHKTSLTVKANIEAGIQKVYTSEYWTEEKRKEKSEERKQYYIDFPEKHPNRILAGNRRRMTFPERVAYDWFVARNIPVVHNKKVDRFYPDFIVMNIIVEIDGARFHDAERDKKRDQILNSLGYVVYRIKATDKIDERLTEIFSKHQTTVDMVWEQRRFESCISDQIPRDSSAR